MPNKINKDKMQQGIFVFFGLIDLKINTRKKWIARQIYEKEDPGAVGFTSGFSREK